MTKKLAVAVLGIAALVLNPVAACSLLTEPSYQFGAAQLRSAVEGTWTITVPSRLDTPPLEYTVAITQSRTKVSTSSRAPSLIASASACGDRSLVRSASACIDTTTMPLDIQIVNGPSTNGSSGKLVVIGTSFSAGRLTAEIDGHTFNAVITPEGVATEAMIFVGGEHHAADMVRMAPAAAAAPAPKT